MGIEKGFLKEVYFGNIGVSILRFLCIGSSRLYFSLIDG